MGGSGNTYVLNDKSNLTSENWFILFAEKLQNFQPAGLLINCTSQKSWVGFDTVLFLNAFARVLNHTICFFTLHNTFLLLFTTYMFMSNALRHVQNLDEVLFLYFMGHKFTPMPTLHS